MNIIYYYYYCGVADPDPNPNPARYPGIYIWHIQMDSPLQCAMYDKHSTKAVCFVFCVAFLIRLA